MASKAACRSKLFTPAWELDAMSKVNSGAGEAASNDYTHSADTYSAMLQ